MIDFIKAEVVSVDVKRLLQSKYLDFIGEFDVKTGEIKDRVIAKYNDLQFFIYKNDRVLMKGSLHKYSNEGKYNFDDFTFNQMDNVLSDLLLKFGISANQIILQNIEIGVNIKVSHDVNTLLKNCFNHKKTGFKWFYVPNEGQIIKAEHSHYIVKMYDKGKHCRAKGHCVDGNILRFEVKYIKMEQLNNGGVVTLLDILQRPLKWYSDLLLKEWNNVLMYDYTIEHKSRSLLNYKNPNYWGELTQKERREAYKKHKNKLKQITKTSSLNIQEQIAEQITSKVIDLYQKGTRIDHITGGCKTHKRVPELTDKKREQENTKGTRIDTLYIVSKGVPPRICIVTGMNISMQRKDSRVLSHTGLKELHTNSPEVYDRIRQKYLSDRWQGVSFKEEVRRLAHSIRNKKQQLFKQ